MFVSNIPSFYNGKVFCPCTWIYGIPRKELKFLLDQWHERRMLMSSSLDEKFNSKASSNQSKCACLVDKGLDMVEPSCSSAVETDMATEKRTAIKRSCQL